MIDPSTFEDVIYDVRGRAAWIIINRPKLYNAFRAQTIEELIAAFKLASDDRAVSSVVLTGAGDRSEEHTSELQSLMRISYAVFCLKKKTNRRTHMTLLV